MGDSPKEEKLNGTHGVLPSVSLRHGKRDLKPSRNVVIRERP